MNRVEELRDLLAAARRNNWEGAPTSGMVVRVTVHRTPDDLPEKLWSQDTYLCIESLDFTFTATDHVPTVVHRTHSRPWVHGTEKRISYTRAKELLAQPLGQSELHQH